VIRILFVGFLGVILSSQVYCSGLVLELQAPIIPAPVPGPVQLTAVVKNNSTEKVTFSEISYPFQDVKCLGPNSWKKIERVDDVVQQWDGVLPITELNPGETVSYSLSLNDFFKEFEVGVQTVSVTFPVWLITNDQEQRVDLTGKVSLALVKGDSETLKESVLSAVHEPDKGRRLSRFRNLLGVNDPSLVEVFIDALRDKGLIEFHHDARKKIVELLNLSGDWGLLIGYLAKYGVRSDQYFFNFFKREGVELTRSQHAMLNDAANYWIRTYSLKLSQDLGLKVDGKVQSLKNELNDLGLEVEKLR